MHRVKDLTVFVVATLMRCNNSVRGDNSNLVNIDFEANGFKCPTPWNTVTVGAMPDSLKLVHLAVLVNTGFEVMWHKCKGGGFVLLKSFSNGFMLP